MRREQGDASKTGAFILVAFPVCFGREGLSKEIARRGEKGTLPVPKAYDEPGGELKVVLPQV